MVVMPRRTGRRTPSLLRAAAGMEVTLGYEDTRRHMTGGEDRSQDDLEEMVGERSECGRERFVEW